MERAAARFLLAGLLLLIAWGLCHTPTQMPGGQPGAGDADLYRAIVRRVAHGQDYYAAAAAEQRTRLYPLRPFTAIRPPLLAWTVAAIGTGAANILLMLLAVTTATATAVRLAPLLRAPFREIAIGLAVTSAGALVQPGMWVWHEIWAGLLIALALACRSGRLWPASVALGLTAALLRELALPFPLVMAFFAWREGQRREALAWTVAFGLAAAALGLHVFWADAVARPGDPMSPGWLMLGGWPFDLALARQTSLLIMAPAWVAAIAAPLALLGWCAWGNTYARRCAAMLGLWMGAFLFVGRPDNSYWGFLFAPILPIGLAMVPRALAGLWRAARLPLPLPSARFPAKA